MTSTAGAASSFNTAPSVGSTEVNNYDNSNITTAVAPDTISLSKIEDLIDKADTPLSTQRQDALHRLADELQDDRVISVLARSPAHDLHAVFMPLLDPQPRPRLWIKKDSVKDDRSYRGESGRRLFTSFLTSISSVLGHMPADGDLTQHYAVKLLIGISELLTLKVDDDGSQEEMALDVETARAALKMLNRCLTIPAIEHELRRVGPTILWGFWGAGGMPVEGLADEELMQDVMLRMVRVLASARALREMVEEGFAGAEEADVRRAKVIALGAALFAAFRQLMRLQTED